MAYKLERANSAPLEVEIGDETLSIPIQGMSAYRRVLEAQGKLKDIQTKINTMQEAKKEITKELVDFLGETVIYLFQVAFGEENTEKILNFYEGNYDEMLMKVYPFFMNVYLPALKESARTESKAYAKRLAGVS